MKKFIFRFLVLSFTTCGCISSLYSYSLYSSSGLGEPITKVGLLKVNTPKDWVFEVRFLGEVVNVSEDTIGDSKFDFTIPYVSWELGLPKVASGELGLSAGLEELLNFNYDITSSWEKIGSDSVYREISSRGSASLLKLSSKWSVPESFLSRIGHLELLDFEFGGFIIFGSAQEAWTNNFSAGCANSYDTLEIDFNGCGIMGGLGIKIGGVEGAINYFNNSSSGVVFRDKKCEFPARIISSLNYDVTQDIKVGIGFENWAFSEPYIPLREYSLMTEFGFPSLSTRKPKFSLGGYSKEWYYNDITEKGGTFGFNIPLKSLCLLGMNIEYGERGTDSGACAGIKEKVYKIYISIRGMESF